MKILLTSILMLSLGAVGCSSSSTQFDENGEKVLAVLMKEQRYKSNVHEFAEVKLERDITAEDSLNFLLNEETVKKIISEHDRMLENIKYQITKSQDPAYAYDGSSSIEEWIDECNQFADAWTGTFNDKFTFNTYYKQIFRLRNLPKNEVIAKIYTVKYKRKEDKEWSTDYWILNSGLSATYLGKIDVGQTKKIPKSNVDLESIHFDYVVR